MECAKWEEVGLLYAAKELASNACNGYESHLKACEYCANELAAYQSDKSRFFSVEMLTELPSEKTDREILRVASSPVQRTKVGFPLFAPFLKKTSLALMVLVMGFGGTSYFVYMAQSTQTNKAAVVTKAPAIAPVASVSQEINAIQPDTTLDSVIENKTQLVDVPKLGNINAEGVITVKELQE